MAVSSSSDEELQELQLLRGWNHPADLLQQLFFRNRWEYQRGVVVPSRLSFLDSDGSCIGAVDISAESFSTKSERSRTGQPVEKTEAEELEQLGVGRLFSPGGQHWDPAAPRRTPGCNCLCEFQLL